MRRESVVSCATVCALGAVAFFLRWGQVNNSFETDTGLLIKGTMWTTAVVIICLIAVAAVVFLAFSLPKNSMPLEYHKAMHINSFLFPAATVVLGIMMMVGSLAFVLNSGGDTLLRWVGILGLISSVCIPVMARTSKERGGALACAASFVPVVFYCIWLMAGYKVNAETPVIWSYSIEILATATGAIGFYYGAGYPFGKPRPRKTVLFCMLGAFFGIAALGDFHGFAKSMMLASGAFTQLLIAMLLIKNGIPGTRQKERKQS